MRIRVSVGLLGAAVSLGVAFAGNATAEDIDDGWPYGGVGGLTPSSLALPGFLVIAQGYGTNEGQHAFGPIVDNWGDYTATHDVDKTDDWYTVHDNTFIIPGLYTNQHTEVTNVLDDAAGYPSVGTVYDETELFRSNSPVGAIDWFTSSTLNDPEVGYASQFTMWPLFMNTFLYTDDGMKDVVSSFGQQFTVFELPFTDASGAGDASDAGGGFAQLLAELAGAAPGATDLL
ncbi:hypothetical protein [Mycolicibacter algericus]|uniref:hypothetical protein n=1 Tax=Mycolicibacter algericus TaxID=1288388 RepID=UPI003C77696F